jgi:hypothetical protein
VIPYDVADDMREEIKRLRAAIKWVVNDMSYKPPEMAAECAARWHNVLLRAIEQPDHSSGGAS